MAGPEFTLASVAPPATSRMPMEEIDCRWIWALDVHDVKVDSGNVSVYRSTRHPFQMLTLAGGRLFRSTKIGTDSKHRLYAVRELDLS